MRRRSRDTEERLASELAFVKNQLKEVSRAALDREGGGCAMLLLVRLAAVECTYSVPPPPT